MGKKIEDIEGIGPVYGAKLRSAGITSIEKLLTKGASRKDRNALAKETGIDGKKILTWVNLADLCRIKGVATQYSELLEAAGVDSVKELRNRNAANLCTKMKEVNDVKKLCRNPPSESQVTSWVEQAKELPPCISY